MAPFSLTQHCYPIWCLVPPLEQRRLVAAALSYTAGSELAPGVKERRLLQQVVLGELTLEQVLAQLGLP